MCEGSLFQLQQLHHEIESVAATELSVIYLYVGALASTILIYTVLLRICYSAVTQWRAFLRPGQLF